MTLVVDLSNLALGIPLNPLPPPELTLDASIPHAPKRNPDFISPDEFYLAIENALRYFPQKYHPLLSKEFANELTTYGHIYMYRFRPKSYNIRAYPISFYSSTKLTKCKCIQIMIMNNLDVKVAQFPHELITYGGNGSVLNNWAQYHLLMKYLSLMTDEQMLVMMSGHPCGLFPKPKPSPSSLSTPCMVITNGLMVPNYSSKSNLNRLYALGCTLYGQMTAGSFCYIGPQGIVHGTTITILNAGRKYLGLQSLKSSGVAYLSSGLGGMSGAQGKAAMILGCIGVIAEVDIKAIEKRYAQGWINIIINDLDILFARVKKAKENKECIAIAFHGNIVTLMEKLAQYTIERNELLFELASDQTSLHNPNNGGYYPYQISFENAQLMMNENPCNFLLLVKQSLKAQVRAINILCKYGMNFWDYGNGFLLESFRANADILSSMDGEIANESKLDFRYPSYVEDIMGDIFSLGFGPFRWICTSLLQSDLLKTDEIACSVLTQMKECESERCIIEQLEDNIFWIKNAHKNGLVVGSQARILYANASARIKIALVMNECIANGEISAPIVLSRDHHDVSGTDSPFRETSNIEDGSNICADMSVQNFVGDGFRGATWIALHNGGGVGWGQVMNGGFGLVLDGTKEAEMNAKEMLFWDVNNGIYRRAWARNENALMQIKRAMKNEKRLNVTMPHLMDDELRESMKKNISSKL